MKMNINDYKNACIRYIDEYKIADYKKTLATGKPQNNYASAGKRIDACIKMLDNLGDIISIEGAPMSAKADYIINCGFVAEMVVAEFFYRLNGYGKHSELSATNTVDYDIAGKAGKYEIKYNYSNKYRCTALNKNSSAKFVYLVTAKAVYKIPFAIALASEVQYGNSEKHRAIEPKNIANIEQYELKTYTENLLK